jgi:hypothetical protein
MKKQMKKKKLNGIKADVSRSRRFVEDNDFFGKLNLKKLGIDKFTKNELIEIIEILNIDMENSTQFWDGG